MKEIIEEGGRLVLIEQVKEGTKYYLNFRTCQNSSSSCLCTLQDNGIELPLDKDGKCRTQFEPNPDCDDFF